MAEHGPKDVAREIETLVSDLAEGLTEADLIAVGWEALNMIVLRTKAGLDVNLSPFTEYSPTYKQERTKAGYSAKVDLARTGHMLGAIIPQAGPGEVSLSFASQQDAIKAAVHNDGVDKTVSVSTHRRSVYVNSKTGQRVGRDEVRRDKRRKNKRVTARAEQVTSFQRHQRTPKREFFDIRHPSEIAALEDAVGTQLVNRLEKAFK